jgi:hypothetical protein
VSGPWRCEQCGASHRIGHVNRADFDWVYGDHPDEDLLDDLTDDEARRALDLGLCNYLIDSMF